MFFIPGLDFICLGVEWNLEKSNPKLGFVPLGKMAKLGRDLPEACRIFKKEVLSMFFFCVNVYLMGLITDVLSSNVCMNKWTHMLNANRQLCGCVNKICPRASQQLHFLPANWITNWLFAQEIIITKTFLMYRPHEKEKKGLKNWIFYRWFAFFHRWMLCPQNLICHRAQGLIL